MTQFRSCRLWIGGEERTRSRDGGGGGRRKRRERYSGDFHFTWRPFSCKEKNKGCYYIPQILLNEAFLKKWKLNRSNRIILSDVGRVTRRTTTSTHRPRCRLPFLERRMSWCKDRGNKSPPPREIASSTQPATQPDPHYLLRSTGREGEESPPPKKGPESPKRSIFYMYYVGNVGKTRAWKQKRKLPTPWGNDRVTSPKAGLKAPLMEGLFAVWAGGVADNDRGEGREKGMGSKTFFYIQKRPPLPFFW